MRWNVVTCHAAIAGDVVDVVAKFARADYFPWNIITCCVTAAAHGHLHVLQWLGLQDIGVLGMQIYLSK